MQIAPGRNLSSVKVENQSAIRYMIYRSGPISRLEIAETLGLALPTITTNVSTLIARGLVKEVGSVAQAQKALGRRTTLIDIAEDARCFLGIEMRGSLRRAVVADYRGRILYSAADNTPYDDYESDVKATGAMARELLERSGLRAKLSGVGVAVPGLVDSGKGVLKVHPGYHWENKDLGAAFRAELGYDGPISVDNNACARAYGAHLFRQDLLKGALSFAYLYVSAGIACPLCLNSLRLGVTVAGEGEVGHMVMDPWGPECSCGNHGCLEAYASERAVLARSAEALRAGKAPLLRSVCSDPGALTVETVLRAQEMGDEDVTAIMEEAVFRLGLAVANIDNFVRPDCMLIDCKYFQLGENRARLMEVIHRNLYTETIKDVKFSFLPPDEYSGAMGAVASAIRRDLETYVE